MLIMRCYGLDVSSVIRVVLEHMLVCIGMQSACKWFSHTTGGRLPLLFARAAVITRNWNVRELN